MGHRMHVKFFGRVSDNILFMPKFILHLECKGASLQIVRGTMVRFWYVLIAKLRMIHAGPKICQVELILKTK